MSETAVLDTTGGGSRRWLVLFVGLIALTAGCTFQYGLAYLIPALRQQGFSLELAGILVACPTAGLLLTLIGWGAAADRWGERVVLSAGLGLAGLILLGIRDVRGAAGLGAGLALAGAAGGSVFAASGRLILGWFARRERGLAMGIRQSAQPLGVAVAAVTLPNLAAGGLGAPLVFMGVLCLVSAVAVLVLVRDPARAPALPSSARPGSPYRQGVLWRIHLASALLVVSQFTVSTFALVFLVQARGWSAPDAGRLLAVGQALGAAARLGAGWWSDRSGSRMRPMRILAVSTGVAMLALAGAAAAHSPVAVAVLLACGLVAVSTNGLAFTAVAEYAGSAWAGRALGIQNTGQNALAAATPPVLALAIGAIGFSASFGLVAVFPLAAAAVVPVAFERSAAAAADAAKASARTPGG
ncbi:MAG TPA: MFS transporter [Streptosporangiaceae bacterium]|jgi:sugar phosphate permease|nr:MFS transporter [Streptosporangiaceae bacterium]